MMSAYQAAPDAAAPLRPPVTTSAKREVRFMEALRERYGAIDDEEENQAATGAAASDPTFTQGGKWQFVGVQHTRAKQSRHDRLTLVVLRNCGITVAAPQEIAEACMRNLEELDLSENAALPLAEVGKMLLHFPRLVTLQLCDIPNILLPPPPSPAAAGVPSSTVEVALRSAQLTKLVLNNAGFHTLAQLCALVELPQLKELHLDANRLTSLDVGAAADPTAVIFPGVTTLSLAHNALSDWRAIGDAITHAFPALTQLFLTDNKLQDLVLPQHMIQRAAAGGGDAGTPALGDTQEAMKEEEEILRQAYRYLCPLTLLCVNDNATLCDPRTVDAIRVLCPHLTTFRITYRTLLPTWNESNSRMYVVAALPTLTLLNRGTVRPKERLDSELLYIQRGLLQREREEKGMEEEEQAQAAKISYALLDVLKEKHKDVVLSIQREGDTATSTGAAYIMLSVTLFFVNGYAAAPSSSATAAASNLAQQTHSLPSSLTIAKLKSLIHKVFQVKPMNQRLSYRSGDEGVLESQTPLENELETLASCGVGNGAIVYVEDASLR